MKWRQLKLVLFSFDLGTSENIFMVAGIQVFLVLNRHWQEAAVDKEAAFLGLTVYLGCMLTELLEMANHV